MTKSYKTAMGKIVDMDAMRLANEKTIAVGNYKVNARGDELGHGGEVVKTRAQLMQEYHKLSSPVADNAPVQESIPASKLKTPIAEDSPVLESAADVAAQYVETYSDDNENENSSNQLEEDDSEQQSNDDNI